MVVEIRTSQDLLDLLDNNEEFRRAAQRALLTDGLLELPDIVREMQQTQRLMIQRIDRMDLQIQEMQQTQLLMIQRIDRMDLQIQEMQQTQKLMIQRMDRMDERQDRMEDLLARVVAQQELTNERLDRMDARMDRMDARFDQVDARFEQVDARFDQVDARFEQVDARFDQVDATIASLDKRVGDIDGRLRGWELERESMAKLLPRLAREYGVVRIKAVSADSRRSAIRVNYVWEARFDEAVGAALDERRITAEEEGVISRTDIVARGLRIADGSDLWFVVQASVTIDDGDIDRAAAGAVALRKVSGDDAEAVVYGRRIAAQQRVRADELGVAVMLDDEGEQEQSAAISTSPSPGAPSDGWQSLSDIRPKPGDRKPRRMMFPDSSVVAIPLWNHVALEVVRWLTNNGRLDASHCPIRHDASKYIVDVQPTHPGNRGGFVKTQEVNSLHVDLHYNASRAANNARIIIEHVGMDASQFKLRW